MFKSFPAILIETQSVFVFITCLIFSDSYLCNSVKIDPFQSRRILLAFVIP